MDEWQKVEHTVDCDWTKRKIKRTMKWWKMMNLKNCPTCNGRLV